MAPLEAVVGLAPHSALTDSTGNERQTRHKRGGVRDTVTLVADGRRGNQTCHFWRQGVDSMTETRAPKTERQDHPEAHSSP